MQLRRSLLMAMLSMGVAYAAYPYITLWQLGHAIRNGDAATLHSLVNWPKVRAGIKEDICDLPPDPSQASSSLPAFGSSFVRGVMANAVDRHVTPEAVVAAVSTAGPVGAPPPGGLSHLASAVVPADTPPPIGDDVRITWAFFETPSVFSVSLKAAGRPEPIALQMELKDGRWRVTRVWLPDTLLMQANSRT